MDINNNDNTNNNDNNNNNFSLSEFLCKQSFFPAGVYGDNQAEILKDFVKVQSEIPSIKKEGAAKGSKSNSPNYKYAKLDDILETIKPILTKHNFAITQNTYSDSEIIGVQTILLHSSGGGIRSTPLANAYSKILYNGNELQNIGSLLSYCRRYSVNGMLCLELDDDDGKNWASKNSYSNDSYNNNNYSNQQSYNKQNNNDQTENNKNYLITNEQKDNIANLMNTLKMDWPQFLKATNMNSDLSMDDLTKVNADKIASTLQSRIDKIKEKQASSAQ